MPAIEFKDKNYQITDIHREKCSRVVPMRVLALGLCKTGTESLMEALRILGYNEAYHGWVALLNNPRDYAMWQKALHAKYDGIGKPFGREEFDRLLGHCQAVSDIPALCFTEELIKAYPEAKVILTVRDIDEWQRSIETIFARSGKWRLKILIPFLRTLTLLCGSRFHWVFVTIPRAGKELFGTNLHSEGRAIYESHYKMVEALVPPENLLHYHVNEGWEPLCRFLNQPVPSVPVPDVNSKEDMRLRMRASVRLALRECILHTIRFVAYICLLVVLCKRLRVGEWGLLSMFNALESG
ncbi:NAD dependent epimerase/dehydratase [Aspergillus terreus]|uniref:NAD dependent epimerase/dehydratase n=1 Tax=Aspergillus terreus TaxID=33178 RepID=A0A5M3YXW9_ASPTE|nr:hypothetical protein ATETN484_0004003200 [Aspergillus terreus]GFF12922.1 NAD dependent epimerase/dehydratase [Aspergillus terreus]